ncbi:SMI1/KNR4 family protein [Streptomyces sp. NPDC057460]|uniref:SMI1/KNR4 family protein n=1 Tax=Streptomyces sp. NPDC057460 TaxID=3346141 RepID=UPI0036798A13
MDADHARAEGLDALRAAFTTGCVPALGWDAVRAFEAEHGIVLPEPYRTFVAEVCDGSTDGPPEWGLLPLAALPAGWRGGGAGRDLAKPFPLTARWVWADDPWSAEESRPAIDAVSDHGSIILGDEGCGMYWHLVVTGPGRGHIWLVFEDGAVPFGAEFDYEPGDAAFPNGEAGFAGWVKH